MLRWSVSLLVGAVALLLVKPLFSIPDPVSLLLMIARHRNDLASLGPGTRLEALVLLRSPEAYRRIGFLYSAWWFLVPWAASFLALSGKETGKAGRLPEYVPPERRESLEVVLGVVHERLSAKPSRKPEWLGIPEVGLYGGLSLVGATGMGKTNVIEAVVEQVLNFKRSDEREKCSALFLEVKGNFSEMVRRVAAEAGRTDDVRVIGEWHYNPLGNLALKSSELGDTIGAFMAEARVSGGALEAFFWRHAGSSLNGNAIEALRLAGEAATLTKVFRLIGDPALMRKKILQAEERINGKLYYTFSKDVMRRYGRVLKRYDPMAGFATGEFRIEYSADVDRYCHPLDDPTSGAKRPSRTRDIEHGEIRAGGLGDEGLAKRLETLKFDIEKVWEQIPKERWAEIALASAETLKLFADPELEEIYCPQPDDPRLLAPMGELMDSGKLVVVKYSAADEKLSRLVATILKATGAAAHPSREACLSLQGLVVFPNLQDYEAAVVEHLTTGG